MISIIKANINDIPIIQEIAKKTWPFTYKEILSKLQLNYMLDKFYSNTTLIENFKNNNHQFLLAKEEAVCIGFACFEHQYLANATTRLHKIYLLPESQGKGIGKLLLAEIERLAQINSDKIISLNVNRFNSATTFYKKIGFKIVREENIELEFGYLMEDYFMEKIISN